jgi:hypothetical protein
LSTSRVRSSLTYRRCTECSTALVGEHISLTNQIRSILLEGGYVVAQGHARLRLLGHGRLGDGRLPSGRRRRGLHDTVLACAAGIFRAAGHQHPELRRHHVKSLADVSRIRCSARGNTGRSCR